jgi:hypothetical protein
MGSTSRPLSIHRRRIVSLLAFTVVIVLWALPTQALAQNARRDLARLRVQIQQELRARPEVRAVIDEWDRARTDYVAVKRAVTYELTRDSTYLALRADMWAAEDELEALHHRYRNGVVPIEQVRALAQRILDLRRQMSQLELEAIARHGKLIEAREAYVAAGRRLVEMRREMGQLLRADPRFQQALDRLRSTGGGGAVGTGSGGLRGPRRP